MFEDVVIPFSLDFTYTCENVCNLERLTCAKVT